MADHAIANLRIDSNQRLSSLVNQRHHALSFCSVLLYSPGEIRPATKDWGWTLRCVNHHVEFGFRTRREAVECQRLWPFENGECWDFWREAALRAIGQGKENVFYEARKAIFFPEVPPQLSLDEALSLLRLSGAAIEAFNEQGASECDPIYKVGPDVVYDPKAKAFRDRAPSEKCA